MRFYMHLKLSIRSYPFLLIIQTEIAVQCIKSAITKLSITSKQIKRTYLLLILLLPSILNVVLPATNN